MSLLHTVRRSVALCCRNGTTGSSRENIPASWRRTIGCGLSAGSSRERRGGPEPDLGHPNLGNGDRYRGPVHPSSELGPAEEANYVQRMGRSGRRDGNALNLVLVNSRVHDLQFWEDPIPMLAGQVRPPGVFLAAEEVLLRQVTAFRWTPTSPARMRRGIAERSGTCSNGGRPAP